MGRKQDYNDLRMIYDKKNLILVVVLFIICSGCNLFYPHKQGKMKANKHRCCITDPSLSDSLSKFFNSIDEYKNEGYQLYDKLFFYDNCGAPSVFVSRTPQLGIISDEWTLLGAFTTEDSDILLFYEKDFPAFVDTSVLDIKRAKTIIGRGLFDDLYSDLEAIRLEARYEMINNRWERTFFTDLRMNKEEYVYKENPVILSNVPLLIFFHQCSYNSSCVNNSFSYFISDKNLAESLYNFYSESSLINENSYGIILFSEHEGCPAVIAAHDDCFFVPIKYAHVLGLCSINQTKILVLCQDADTPLLSINKLDKDTAYRYIYSQIHSNYYFCTKELSHNIYIKDKTNWKTVTKTGKFLEHIEK